MTEEGANATSEHSPYSEVYAHLNQVKRILEEWEAEEKALEAKQLKQGEIANAM